VDRRADVFSLGVVLYELLTDQKPFRGSTLSEITKAVLDHQPPAANVVEPSVPAALAEIAARAMEKDPEHRYRSARSLSRELRHWLEENASAGDGAAAEPEPPKRSRMLVWAGAALAGLGLLALGLWLGLATHHEPEAAAATPAPVVQAPPPPAAPAPVVAAAPPAVVPASAAMAGPPAATAIEAPAPAAVVTPPPALAVPAPKAPAPRATTAAPPPKETAREPRMREAQARAAAATPAVVALGTVRIAVSPWGNVEVDGTAVGTTPPLNELTLTEGPHQITVRNADFPPYSANVNVVPGQPVTLRHRFGS
jgi:serine/threonine-protein kinase